jgi:hypothetical protein
MYGGYTITNRTSVRLQFKTTLREERFRDFTVRELDITCTIAKKLKPGNKKKQKKQRKANIICTDYKFQSSPSP